MINTMHGPDRRGQTIPGPTQSAFNTITSRYPLTFYAYLCIIVTGVLLTHQAVQLHLVLGIPPADFEFRYFLLPGLIGILGGSILANLILQRQVALAMHGQPTVLRSNSPTESSQQVQREYRIYIYSILGAAIIVFLFASTQMLVVLDIPLADISGWMYAVPMLVALVFGYLIARVRVLGNRQLQDLDEILHKDRLLEKEIAERKHAESQLRISHTHLAALNRELDAFTHTVSHDLRAPLRAISGFSNALNDDYREHLDAEGQHYLDRIHVACTRMDELINAFMALSRIQLDETHYTTVDLSELARDIIEELREHHPEHQVTVTVNPDLSADGDSRLLRAMLTNLFTNAWKFTQRTPGPHIEFGRQTIEGQAVFFVRDNGAGFDPQQAGEVFTPFHRLHRESEFEGTGVGLATVHKIARLHGGRVWAEGEPGAGACFNFTLGAV